MARKKNTPTSQQKQIRRYYAKRSQQQSLQEVAEVKEQFPHFRYQRNKLKHPALILGNSENKTSSYDYRDCTHTAGHKYTKIANNPKPNDDEPMHISEIIDSKAKSKFSKDVLKWDMSKVPDNLKQKK